MRRSPVVTSASRPVLSLRMLGWGLLPIALGIYVKLSGLDL